MNAVQMSITVPSAAVARTISKALLDERLVACVSVISGVRSRYWWRGRIETASERLLIAKTLIELVPQVIDRVRVLHPYEVPEIIAVPLSGGNPAYLRWIASSVRRSTGKRRM